MSNNQIRGASWWVKYTTPKSVVADNIEKKLKGDSYEDLYFEDSKVSTTIDSYSSEQKMWRQFRKCAAESTNVVVESGVIHCTSLEGSYRLGSFLGPLNPNIIN